MRKIFRYFKTSVIIGLLAITTIVYAARTVKIGYSDATTTDNWQEVSGVDGKLYSVDTGWLHQIMAGNVTGHTYFHIRGHSHNVGTVDQEISALNTAGFGNWPSAAAGVVLVSTDVDDDGDPVDTGARTVIIRGLDDVAGDWVAATATVTLDGTTPTAATAQTFIRIDELEVVTAGSSLTNEGDITASISGTNIVRIYAKHSTSDAGRKTIASDETGHYENPEGSAVGNKEMTYHIFCRDNTVANAPFSLRASWHSKDGGYRPNGKMEPFTEKTDIVLIGHAGLAGAAASASFEGWTETN